MGNPVLNPKEVSGIHFDQILWFKDNLKLFYKNKYWVRTVSICFSDNMHTNEVTSKKISLKLRFPEKLKINIRDYEFCERRQKRCGIS